MESPRGVRMFKRNHRTRSTISSCSSLAMEMKRKKIRDGVLLAQNEVGLRCLVKLCLTLPCNKGTKDSHVFIFIVFILLVTLLPK